MTEKIWNGHESDALLFGLKIDFDDNAKYELVWEDDFDKNFLDLSKWSANGCGSWNGDTEFTYDKEHWNFENSIAKLTMTKYDKPNENGKLYLNSYSFVTSDKMNFQYGYLEMRAKAPFYKKGEFPAFWLLSSQAILSRKQLDYKPTDCRIEIDIFENFSTLDTLVPNLHKYENKDNGRHCQLSGIDNGAAKSGTRVYKFPQGINPNDFHNYGMLWTDKFISFSVDGDFYYTYDLSKNFGDFGSMDGFHQPVGIIISNQIFSEGWAKVNSWAASVGAAKEELFPLDYEIDYVKLYQKKGSKLILNDEPDLKNPLDKSDKRLY